jgi:phage repressor protein C with HTH and peptisase S24 domain
MNNTMSTPAERIEKIMRALGIKENVEFGRMAGASKSVVGQWLSGQIKSIAPDYAYNIQDNTGYNAKWIMLGTGAEKLNTSANESAPSPESNVFPIGSSSKSIDFHIDVYGAMGHGVTLRNQPGEIRQLSVSKEWLAQNVPYHSGAENLAIVTGFGDSMVGMFNSGDPLLVDRGVKTVEYDGVYFFRVGDEGFIKRLQRIPQQGILVISKNPDYRDWMITKDMDFEVFAKVLIAWNGSKL